MPDRPVLTLVKETTPAVTCGGCRHTVPHEETTHMHITSYRADGTPKVTTSLRLCLACAHEIELKLNTHLI